MTKTKEELSALKQEYKTLTEKLKSLSEEELKQVTGGDALGLGYYEPSTGGGSCYIPSERSLLDLEQNNNK